MTTACVVCGGACEGADLAPLLDPRLTWLWEQVGRAGDRRGDADLVAGFLSVRAPTDAEARAAAAGLLGERTLKQGQSRSVDLATLTQKIRVRGPQLTPGAVAAHLRGGPLAARATATGQRRAQEEALARVFDAAVISLPWFGESSLVWMALRRSGWLARITASPRPEHYLRSALAVVAALPASGNRVDRRRLAAVVTGDPHALDHNSVLGSLVIGVLVAAGRIKARQSPRAAWASVGVDCDDVVGGLIAVGILPVGWVVPQGATVTLPPRELKTCDWPAPDVSDSWAFVTENPSIVSAAADLAASGTLVRLLCMSGTPSAVEIAAMARMEHLGWRIAVRADFDAAGIAHVNAVVDAIPQAIPWRMAVSDYLQTLSDDAPDGARLENVPDARWDQGLSLVMRARGVPSYEESLLSLLMDDLRQGRPPSPGGDQTRSPGGPS